MVITAQDSKLKPGYKQTELGIIPEDWIVRTLGQLGELKNGINKGKKDFGHGSPFVNLLDVFGVVTVSNDSGFGLVNSTDTDRKLYNLKKGDVLFVRSSVKPEGVGLTTLVAEDLRDTVFSGFLIRFRDKGELAFEFKEHCFGQLGFRNRLVANSTVSANTNINQSALKNLQIAFPPSPSEQRAIAEALSDMDALITSLNKLIAKKHHIKQATMQQLLTGKTRLPEVSGEWTLSKFEQIATVRKEKVDPRRSGGHSFCVELEHIGQGSGRLLGYSATTEDSSLKSRFNIGDILFGRLRAYLRKYWLADRDGVCSTEIWPLIPNGDVVTGQYLFQLVQTNQFIDSASSAYGTHMPRTDWNVIKNYEVSLPSLNEQRIIFNILSDMDTEITALEQKRDKTHALKQGMMQELLTGKTRLL